ncbi:bifunctional aspartate kinase/homoserine dehydrogenase I [Bacteroidia bacterium]|nr:bifunctional aspartate kinase/homoserine dehydrogenase I [Bacteroidia bacterium]GHT80388.1 bifunctional aspartate kinase/homoserine dehydrogenase I [Bacteroidia bacterium]
MKVLKFGGSSVANAENIKRVKTIVEQSPDNKWVVVSAMGGITDMLLKACQYAACGDAAYQSLLAEIEQRHLQTAKALVNPQQQGHVLSELKVLLNELEDYLQSIVRLRELTARTQDYVLSFGERMSSYLISEVIADAVWVDARPLIKTDSRFGNAKVDLETTYQHCAAALLKMKGRAIIPGFIAGNAEGHTTTLGRGGSDYTAAIVAAALHADSVEIWTDVDGFMTADPHKVEKAYTIPQMTYAEVFELSNFGAKVVYPPTIYPLFSKKIPMYIKNTFSPEAQGTLVNNDKSASGQSIKGISSIDNIVLLTLHGVGMTGVTGISKRLFTALADTQINVILISQASSEQSITFAITPDDENAAQLAINAAFRDEIQHGTINLQIEHGLSIIAIVGENMRRMPGTSAKLFNALGKNGVNIIAIAQGSSELNISTVIQQTDLRKAINLIHEAFFLSGYKQIHLYLAGIGTVGSDLLQQLHQQCESLEQEHRLKIKLVGLMNSKKMFFDTDGIAFDKAKETLVGKGTPMNFNQFTQRIAAINLRNSVFVDCTASEQVAALYEQLLQSFVSVVTANKIANSGAYSHYVKLRDAARSRNVKFLYETNVGAGLPLISTINDLVMSGDKVLKLEAVLSGTLNFIFNTIDENVTMSQAIRMAKEKGYSEPDPRIDLSGVDVLRKILILARECGYSLEKIDIAVNTFLPKEVLNTSSLDEFWSAITNVDADFEAKRKALYAQNKRWRFVATLDQGKASIGLQEVDAQHPFFNLQGSDNIIAIYTERYHAQPMVIKGAGAGAAVTASGVFADIISVANL